jgi:hypothetical protein
MANEEPDVLLARIDERVNMILEALPKLATCERVDAVEDKAEHAYAKAASVHTEVTEHVKNHESMAVNRNLIAGSYIGGLAALAGVLYALFRKGGTP